MRGSCFLIPLLLLGGCAKGGHEGAGANASEPAKPADAPIRVAYSYAYDFRVAQARIGIAQDRHVAMCDRLGVPRCRVLEIHRSTGDYGGGSLKLEVASGFARAFGAGLAQPVEALGGRLVSSDVEAEDVGRQIVDVAARMRAKEALVGRLQQALATRPGTTADLVATEKAVADAQGELDAARSEMAQVQGRVDASPVQIAYERQPSFFDEVHGAFAAGGATVTASVVALIYFLAAVVPWAIAVGLIFLAWRGWRRHLRQRSRRGEGA